MSALYYYLAFHLPTKTKHYRARACRSQLDFLKEIDRWNASARGTWQFHSVEPGYAAPRDLSKYEVTNVEYSVQPFPGGDLR